MIKYIFIELTNHCNFNCTFCPEGVMSRRKEFMEKELVFRLIDEISAKKLTDEPLQLHLMGEPLLYPHLFEVIDHLHEKKLSVRLFTNGALLNERNRERIYAAEVEELVIGVHTFSEVLYRDFKTKKFNYESYMNRIKETIEDKFRTHSGMRIYLQYLNTKHFNSSRLDKNYPDAVIPLVDTHQKAFRVIEEWKEFGRTASAKYGLGHEPVDLECLQGRFKDEPLDCLKGDHSEVLPAVILSFKDISTFSDYLMQNVKYVERYKFRCPSPDEQLAVLADGSCTPCCVDYDGRMTIGNVRNRSLESVWKSGKLRKLQSELRAGFLPTPLCRVCNAILVMDDYEKKFPNCEEEPFKLKCGWYSLEGSGEEAFRWTGKRAALVLKGNGRRMEFEVKNGHPRRAWMKLSVQQKKRRKVYRLGNGAWEKLVFKIGSREKKGGEIVLETDEFWIPSECFDNSEDRRELGVMVRKIRMGDKER